MTKQTIQTIKKGYKQTEIGILPEDWNIDKVKNIAKITTGAKNTQDKIDSGVYPFFVRSQTVEKINSYSYDGEAILTAGDGVGTGKVFHYIKGKFDFHQRVYKISNFIDSINSYYFFLYFSNNFYNRIMQMTAKTSVDSVRMEMITDMQIPIPPTIAEQTAIANVLFDTDTLIEHLGKMIAKKEDIKQGTIQKLLTGKKRLPGFSGKWKMKSLFKLGNIYGGLYGKSKNDFENGVYPYIPFLNILNNPIIDIKYFDYVNIEAGENQNKVMKGDLFFNQSSETPEEVGMCSVLQREYPKSLFK